MGATKPGTVLEALELDAATIESLPEPVLSELIGFIEYDNQLARQDCEQAERRWREMSGSSTNAR